MDVSNLLDAFMQSGEQINNEWSMYIVVHLGLFWFFLFMHRPLLAIERLIAIFAYGVFAFINGNGLIATYKMLEAVRIDLVTRFPEGFSSAPELANVLSETSYAGREELIFLTHGCAFAVVTLMFLFRNIMIRRYYQHFPEQLGKQNSPLG